MHLSTIIQGLWGCSASHAFSSVNECARNMSTLSSGPGNKVDKSKGKFKTIDINTVYKGSSVAPPRASGRQIYIYI